MISCCRQTMLAGVGMLNDLSCCGGGGWGGGSRSATSTAAATAAAVSTETPAAIAMNWLSPHKPGGEGSRTGNTVLLRLPEAVPKEKLEFARSPGTSTADRQLAWSCTCMGARLAPPCIRQ